MATKNYKKIIELNWISFAKGFVISLASSLLGKMFVFKSFDLEVFAMFWLLFALIFISILNGKILSSLWKEDDFKGENDNSFFLLDFLITFSVLTVGSSFLSEVDSLVKNQTILSFFRIIIFGSLNGTLFLLISFLQKQKGGHFSP